MLLARGRHGTIPLKAKIIGQARSKRHGTTKDIGKHCQFLRQDAPYINGQIIPPGDGADSI